MSSLDELSKSGSKISFLKHVFNFNEDSQSEMTNIVQYAITALIPVIVLNKSMQHFIPEADDQKGSIELVVEIVGQVVIMFIGILIIHRMITFFPTYSGEKYTDFSITNIVLAFLIIVLSLQTKLGEKVSILVNRVIDAWEGKGSQTDSKKKSKSGVKVSQPISQQQQQTTSISSLPPPSQQQQQPSTDFNDMYQQQPTPLVAAQEPMSDGPQAANAGGGAFGSAFGSGW